jgi:hypothetical protein
MAPENVLSLVLSAGALIVSLVALYAEFFRHRVRLNAVLVEKSFGPYPAWFQYAVANSGDVQVVLRTMACTGATFTFLSQTPELPCVLAPGDVKLVRIQNTGADGEPVAVTFEAVTARGSILTASHAVTGALHVLGREGPYWAVFPFRAQ